MSNLIGKAVSKLLVVIIAVALVLEFRTAILTDKDLSAAFGGLMGALPFAGMITGKVCQILKYQYSVPLITTSSVTKDLLKLAVMALIQGPVVGLLSAIFLKVPDGDWEDREKFMKGPSYTIKSTLLKIVTAPLLAVVSARLCQWIMTSLENALGYALSVAMGLVAVAGTTILSTIWLMAAGLSFGKALLWRLTVTLGGKMVFTFLINAMCLAIYVAILGGVSSHVLASVFSLVVILIIEELAMKLMRQAVVG